VYILGPAPQVANQPGAVDESASGIASRGLIKAPDEVRLVSIRSALVAAS
jgi:hypothetical protein